MTAELQDVFQFMAIRAGEKLDKSKSRKNFIRDDDYQYRGSDLHLERFNSQTSAFVRPNGVNAGIKSK